MDWPQCRWGKFLFEETIAEFKKRSGTIIVEIGAIRDPKPSAEKTDGWATLKWSALDCELHTVDLDPKAIATTTKLVKNPRINYHVHDGLEFLKDFAGPIDLLYLDGPDADKKGQLLALEMFAMADLSSIALVLIDDCDMAPKERWQGRGKGELVIPYACKHGYTVLRDNDRQVLLGKEISDATA